MLTNILHLMWAIVASLCTNLDDVVFGITVTMRSAATS